MNKIITIVCGISFSVLSLHTNGQVLFEEGSMKGAFEKARLENKLIFLDCYTSWCGPCKKMLKEVFSRTDVGDFMNKHFVNCKQDMEQGEGKDLAKTYGVTVYPTFLILNHQGELVHRSVGGQSAKDFLQNMRTGCGENSLYSFQKRYQQGERNSHFILQYVELLSNAYMQEEKESIVREYWATLSKDSRCSMDGWTMLKRFVHDTKSPEYSYLLEHKPAYEKIVGKEEVDAKLFGDIYPLLVNHCSDMIFGNRPISVDALDEYVSLIEKADVQRKGFLLQQLQFTRFFASDDLKSALWMYKNELSSWKVDERLTATLQLNGMLYTKGSKQHCRQGIKAILSTMKECGWEETNPMFSTILEGLRKKVSQEK